MGKGQRARDTRAQDKIDNPQKYTAKKKTTVKKSKAWVTPLVTALVIVLLVGIFVVTYLNDSGIILRGKTVMETENFKVSGTMMQYATMSTYQNFVNQYSDIIQYFGLDTSRSLASQKYGEGTWLDYFRDGAELSLETTLVYAEAAKADGVELDEDEKKEIEDSVKNIATAAKLNGYTKKAYMAMLFGKGVNEKDIKDFHTLTALAAKYEEQTADKVEGEITDEDINAYYKENMDDYSLADVLTYSDTLKLDASLSADEKAAKKAEFLAKFDAMANAASADDFKAALEAYLTAAEVDDVDKALTSAEKTSAKSGISEKDASEWVFEISEDAYIRADGDVKVFTDDDEAEEKTEDEAEDTAEDTAAETEADTAAETEADTAADTAEDTGAEPAEASEEANNGEIDASELVGEADDKDSEEVEYTVSVYYIVRAPYANEEETKNVGHLLVRYDDYATKEEAKAEAERLYEEYKAGDMTKESFEKIAEANTADSGVFYDNVKQGDMVPEFDEWLFDEARKEGDTDIVETADYGYHVMYFVGEGLPAWQADCRTALVGEKTGDILKELQEKYPIEVNESAMKAVKG